MSEISVVEIVVTDDTAPSVVEVRIPGIQGPAGPPGPQSVPFAREINSGDGLTGGGDLSADRTLAVDATVVRTTREVATSDGLTGGGDLSGNRTLSIADGGVALAKLAADARAAGNHTYDNATSGLAATNVQAAVDEIVSDVDEIVSDIEGLDAIYLKPFVSSAFVTASGTAVEFTGIPDSQEIVISLKGFSTNGTSRPLIQLGTSSGFVTTGYEATSGLLFGTTPATFESVNGFPINSNSASHILDGVIRLIRVQGNTWAVQGNVASRTSAAQAMSVNGLITLAAAADRVRVTTVGGSDTFDAGEINMSYR